MQNKLISHSLSTLRIIAISSLTIFTLYSVQAWVAPTTTAPNGNVAGPITTSNIAQTKSGDLTVNNLKLPAGGAIFGANTGTNIGTVDIISNTTARAGINFKNSTGVYLGSIYSYTNSGVGTPGFGIKNPDGSWGFTTYNGGDVQITKDSYVMRDNIVKGTTTTANLKVTNGAGAGKVLTSDANGNATWQTPTGGGSSIAIGAGCGGGSYITDLVSNNISHSASDPVAVNGEIKVTTGQSKLITLPADVKIFVLQGAGNNASWTAIDASPTGYGSGGGASYAKAGTRWLAVAGGGGGSAGGTLGKGGNFGTQFTGGSFGMVASTGGGPVGSYSTAGGNGKDGVGGDGGSTYAPFSTGSYSAGGGIGGVGISANGAGGNYYDPGKSGPYPVNNGGAGNAGAGGASGSVIGGGGGYGGGAAGGRLVLGPYNGDSFNYENRYGGGGGGGGYLDPSRSWVCLNPPDYTTGGGVYFKTSDTGFNITIGSSAGGSGGYVKLIY